MNGSDSDDYRPPLEEQLFLLERVIGWDDLFQRPAFAHADAELATAVLTEGARFAAKVLGPINRPGDEHGARLCDGRVLTAPGYREAYRQFAEGGWAGLDLPQDVGGQDLPLLVQTAFGEMIDGACIAFGMLPVMLRAAAWLLVEHGEPELVQRVVPRLVAGDWGATICISEPQAGSDVGRLRTRAVARPDGSYVLSGTKIFISYGDQDLTEQIVHMVLARAPDGPPGTAGISLFLVPKLRFEEGAARNGVSVSRVEKKMGLKGSPTCVLDLDEAVGYRIGPECQGLKCMFTMVNLMRLGVSVQGVAIAGAATAKALRYAADRPQGGPPAKPPVPIIAHADVRRMLLIMRTRTESMRALVMETAKLLDLARTAESEAQRRDARRLAEFLLPVCKACGSETGFEVANLAVQICGGHGYISDTGVEQYVRDSRVAAIYEGTNGIQALDLVTRKLMRDGGTRYGLLQERIRADLRRCVELEEMRELHDALAEGLAELDRCTRRLLDGEELDARDAEAAATDYLQLVGLVAGAWMSLRMARAAQGSDRAALKLVGARFYARYLLPEVAVRVQRIGAGAAVLDALDAASLAQS